MIGIINCGIGNLGSIQNMLKKIGIPSKILEKPDEIEGIAKLILPGVGAFDNGMKNLREQGWIEPLNKSVIEEGKPILGICLGMQMMTLGSEEGIENGLGWVDAQTIKFYFSDPTRKIPHMGWNIVKPVNDPALFRSEEKELRFYHVHSYYVKLANPQEEIGSTYYEYPFTSAFSKDNILGVQFHPEKSHKFGMELLKNFYYHY